MESLHRKKKRMPERAELGQRRLSDKRPVAAGQPWIGLPTCTLLVTARKENTPPSKDLFQT